MGYSRGFLVKIGRFRLIANVPENFTNNPVRCQKSICNHICDVFREFGHFPALAKIRHVQNHGLQQRLFGQNRPISAHCKFSRKLHEHSRRQLEIHLQAYFRRFQGVWADFRHLPKSALLKTMGYSPGFLVKIGNFGSFQILSKTTRTNPYEVRNPFATLFAMLFESFGRFPALTKIRHVQNHWPKSADFDQKAQASLKIFPKKSRTNPCEVRNPFATLFATFLGSLGRFPALAKIRHAPNHGLQPRLFGQNWPISAHCTFSRKLHEQSRMKFEIHLQRYLRRFQGVWADFQHLPKSAMFKTMGYSPGLLFKICRFRFIEISPENFTNKPVCNQKSICKHCQRRFQGVWADFPHWPKSAMFKTMGYSPGFLVKIGRFRLIAHFPETSRTSLYAVRNPFATLFSTGLESLGRFPALAKISHVQNHGLQPRLFGRNWPISAHCKFSRKLDEQVFTQLEIHLQASW